MTRCPQHIILQHNTVRSNRKTRAIGLEIYFDKAGGLTKMAMDTE